MTRLTAGLLIVLLAGYAFHAWAQSQINVRPTVAPIGTSSSNGISFAWFYDATARTVYLCRAGQGVTTALDCKATTQLP